MSKDAEALQPHFQRIVVFQKVTGPNNALSHPCYYDVYNWRAPKMGEWFLDGVTLDTAVRAQRDFDEAAQYWLVRPTNFAIQRWHKGERV